jgi:hypothetical protein
MINVTKRAIHILYQPLFRAIIDKHITMLQLAQTILFKYVITSKRFGGSLLISQFFSMDLRQRFLDQRSCNF